MRLLALALHRLVWFAPTLLGLLVVTFVISRVIPADPVALVAGGGAEPRPGGGGGAGDAGGGGGAAASPRLRSAAARAVRRLHRAAGARRHGHEPLHPASH